MLTRIHEITKGNNFDDKVPFASDCFCSTSLRKGPELRATETPAEERPSAQVLGGRQERAAAWRHSPFPFVRCPTCPSLVCGKPPCHACPPTARPGHCPGVPVQRRRPPGALLFCILDDAMQLQPAAIIKPGPQPELASSLATPTPAPRCRQFLIVPGSPCTGIFVSLSNTRSSSESQGGALGAVGKDNPRWLRAGRGGRGWRGLQLLWTFGEGFGSAATTIWSSTQRGKRV